jgi:outer membrane receptor for ferrienterochelin and colicin
MAHSSNWTSWTRLGAGVSLLTLSSALCMAAPAVAQEQPPAADDVVVVTGFRESLAAAIEAKRVDAGIVDVITAEDIADFPDLNLAESLQRVPGVQIDRDGGEGRTINVRGLSSDFVRVRLNGMEALKKLSRSNSFSPVVFLGKNGFISFSGVIPLVCVAIRFAVKYEAVQRLVILLFSYPSASFTSSIGVSS